MSNNFTSHFSADDAALLLIDFQPQMFMGVESHAVDGHGEDFRGSVRSGGHRRGFPGSRGRRSHVHQRLAHSQFCEGR